LQAVPEEDDTEVVLETTANGVGNLFHGMWADAERGVGDFIAIFVPWYWQEEYTRDVPDDFDATDEEREYQRLYGLTDGQLVWRRAKIQQLKDAALFKQEYPATAAEAFQMSGHDSFIKPEPVAIARKAACLESGPLILGVDPARFGDDSTAIAWRRGRVVTKVERKDKLDTMQVVGVVKQIIDTDKPARVFVDVGGLGAGIFDRLIELGFGKIVRAINFGSAPLEPPKIDPETGKEIGGGPANRRAEMWMASRDWLSQVGGARIPDDDALQADACGPAYKYDSNSRVLLEKKEDMRRRKVKSPDGWDAVALTFAEPVAVEAEPVVLHFESQFSRGGANGVPSYRMEW
jgi:hypothetical protein